MTRWRNPRANHGCSPPRYPVGTWDGVGSLRPLWRPMSSAGEPTEPLRPGAGNWVSTSNSTTLHDGDVILDRFKIVRMLGSGGMGDVYEAFDTELQQTVALKTIRPEIAR